MSEKARGAPEPGDEAERGASQQVKGKPPMEELKAQLAAGAAAFLAAVPGPDGGAAAAAVQHELHKSPLAHVVGLELEWRDLTYAIPLGRGKKRTERIILDSLSGAVQPGRLLAILGPSGCGKSSLLNALSGRLPRGGRLEGEVLVNGRARGRGFRSLAAYVTQDDVMFPNLTVRETFAFAANMRLGSSVSNEAKQQAVEHVVTELGLGGVQDTYVGNAFVRGVSGGERKRVNIGVEMLSNPSLLFLDEPTSGLDAFQAQSVMEALWWLPRSTSPEAGAEGSIYSMFDLLLLLTGGRQMYFGRAADARDYFAGVGFACPPHFNTADFLLDVISVDQRSPETEAATRARVAQLALLHAHERARVLTLDPAPRAAGAAGGKGAAAADGAAGGAGAEEAWLMDQRPAFQNNALREFGLLLGRAWRQNSRDRLTPVVTVVQTLLISAVLAILYSDIPDNQAGIQDIIGIVFFICLFSALTAMIAAITTIPAEQGIIRRERAAKQYRVLPASHAGAAAAAAAALHPRSRAGALALGARLALPPRTCYFASLAIYSRFNSLGHSPLPQYYLSKFLADLPIRIVQGVLSSSIVYWSVGLRAEAGAFFLFILIVVLVGLASQGMAVAISAAVKHEKLALAVAPAATVILVLFSGFLISKVLTRLGFQNNQTWQAIVGLLVLMLLYNTAGYLVLRLKKVGGRAVGGARGRGAPWPRLAPAALGEPQRPAGSLTRPPTPVSSLHAQPRYLALTTAKQDKKK
eukprot:scaffold1.g5572.t1